MIRNRVTKEATTSGIAARQATWDKEGEETEGGGVRERLTQKEHYMVDTDKYMLVGIPPSGNEPLWPLSG